MRWGKRIIKVGAVVMFWIGLGGTPDDLTRWQSVLRWLDGTFDDWRLAVGGIVIFALIQFSDLIPGLRPSKPQPPRLSLKWGSVQLQIARGNPAFLTTRESLKDLLIKPLVLEDDWIAMVTDFVVTNHSPNPVNLEVRLTMDLHHPPHSGTVQFPTDVMRELRRNDPALKTRFIANPLRVLANDSSRTGWLGFVLPRFLLGIDDLTLGSLRMGTEHLKIEDLLSGTQWLIPLKDGAVRDSGRYVVQQPDQEAIRVS